MMPDMAAAGTGDFLLRRMAFGRLDFEREGFLLHHTIHDVPEAHRK